MRRNNDNYSQNAIYEVGERRHKGYYDEGNKYNEEWLKNDLKGGNRERKSKWDDEDEESTKYGGYRNEWKEDKEEKWGGNHYKHEKESENKWGGNRHKHRNESEERKHGTRKERNEWKDDDEELKFGGNKFADRTDLEELKRKYKELENKYADRIKRNQYAGYSNTTNESSLDYLNDYSSSQYRVGQTTLDNYEKDFLKIYQKAREYRKRIENIQKEHEEGKQGGRRKWKDEEEEKWGGVGKRKNYKKDEEDEDEDEDDEEEEERWGGRRKWKEDEEEKWGGRRKWKEDEEEKWGGRKKQKEPEDDEDDDDDQEGGKKRSLRGGKKELNPYMKLMVELSKKLHKMDEYSDILYKFLMKISKRIIEEAKKETGETEINDKVKSASLAIINKGIKKQIDAVRAEVGDLSKGSNGKSKTGSKNYPRKTKRSKKTQMKKPRSKKTQMKKSRSNRGRK